MNYSGIRRLSPTRSSTQKEELTTSRGVQKFQFNSMLQLQGVTDEMLENET